MNEYGISFLLVAYLLFYVRRLPSVSAPRKRLGLAAAIAAVLLGVAILLS